MSTVAVIGLGLMGGSIAKALSGSKYKVVGADKSNEICNAALRDGVISSVWDLDTPLDADVVIICTAPIVAKEFLRTKLRFLKKGAVVSDICGIKREIVYIGEEEAGKQGVFFVGGHPMAGREKSGYEYSTADLFHNRSYIFTTTDSTNDEALDIMKNIAFAIGCSDVTITSPDNHDRMIAFTSQIPHVLAGAYIKSPQSDRHQGFSAGSYHDVSRVASVDENLWTELFMSNSDYLLSELETLIENLLEYKLALSEEDSDKLKLAIRNGRLLKERDININGFEKPHKFG